MGSVTRRLCAAVLAVIVVGCGASDRTTWDLVGHFPFARVASEPDVIDLGRPEARRYLVSGWSIDEETEGTTFVWGTGDRSVLEFYLSEPRDLAVAFRCMPFAFPGAPSQSVSFELNGAGGPSVALGPGMTEYRIVLPRAATKAGMNRLVLGYVYARAPSDVGASADTRRLAAGWDFIRFGAERAATRPKPSIDAADLVVPAGTGVTYDVRVPAETVLRFDAVAVSGDPRTALAIHVESDDEPGVVVGRFDGTRPERDVRIRIPESGIVRLSLDASGVDPSATVRVTRPVLELAASAGRPSPPHGWASAPARPNVVVYLVDTLRADRLGCYGYDRPTSPHLDRFARDAVRFTDAVAEAPWTRAAVASLFTGLPALAHGVTGRADALPDEAVTMAELFGGAGYETAAFVTNGNVAPVYGFAQGFDVFELIPGTVVPGSDDADVPYPSSPPPGSDAVTRAALAWLDGRSSDRPFLLYLHTADPHAPYDAPAPFRERLGVAVDATGLGSLETLRRLGSGTLPVDASLLRSLNLLYDSEVAENDNAFGEVLAGLRERRLYDDALIVFVADHGEEFYEHRGWQHGHTVHAEVEHVPLVVKRPGGEGAGTRVERTVQLADVLPTLLAYVRPDRAPVLPGTSLFRDPAVERAAFVHLDLDGHVADAIVAGGWKLIAASDGLHLFDRAADPGEQRDVAGDHPVTVGYLSAQLAERIASSRPLPGQRSAAVPEDVRRNLRALGYVE